MKAVFIVGEQRSGSNLLRLMLAQAGIAAPHPAHVLTRMMPLVASFGDISKDSNWHQLVDDCCALIERNPVPWNPLETLDRADIASRCRERSLVAIFGAIMDTYAEAHGQDMWACKSMGYIEFASQLDAYFGDPKYIYLYRDGRDVTLSFTKAVIGEKHPYHIARRWAELQRMCLSERERIGPQRFFSLCYEDLLENPENILRDCCKFLDIPFREEMLSFHDSSDAVSTASKSQLWQNLDQPVMKDNSRKFLREMSEESVRIIESVAGDVLDQLGYERVFTQPGQEQVFTPEDLAGFDEENRRSKESQKAFMDSEDLERRQHQLSLLTERVYFLKGLSHAEILRLLAYLEERHYEPGDTVMWQEEPTNDLFFVISGSLEVLQDDEEIAVLADGAPFGELGFITGKPRTASVRALTTSRVFHLRRQDFAALEENDPGIAVRILWAISEHLIVRFA
jgi:hypothetical protein